MSQNKGFSGPTIHNVRLDNHYTIVSNRTGEHPYLTWATKGLLLYILSRDPEWKIYVNQLASIYQGTRHGGGRDAIRSMLNELKEHGYLVHVKHRDSRGHWVHRYDVYPMPIQDFQKMFPEPEYAAPVMPAPESAALYQVLNTPSTDRTKKEKKESNTLAQICGSNESENPKQVSQKDTVQKEAPAPQKPKEPEPPPPKPIKEQKAPQPCPKDDSASFSIDSIPSYSEGFSMDESTLELVNLEEQYLPYFRPEIVARWVKKYKAPMVLKAIRFFFQVKSTQKKPIPKPEAWMEAALRDNYATVDHNCTENKKFAENVKKLYNLKHLKINKRYCYDTTNGKEYYYHLPCSVFQEQILRMTD